MVFFLNLCISHKPTFSFLIPQELWWSLDNRGCYCRTYSKSLVRATSYVITIFTFFLLKPGQEQGQKSSPTTQGNASTWNQRPCSLSLSSLAFFRSYSQKPATTFKASQEWRLSQEILYGKQRPGPATHQKVVENGTAGETRVTWLLTMGLLHLPHDWTPRTGCTKSPSERGRKEQVETSA